jgi:hypothetical protein
MDPIGTISHAFTVFSIGGKKADSIRGHWKGYFANYASFFENVYA